MNPIDFKELVKNRLIEVENILNLKSEEYSSEEDKLSNFKEAGIVDDVSPEQALWGMFLKHFLSVRKMVRGGKVTESLLKEKITDSIAYLLLLEGLLTEKIQNEKDNHKGNLGG